MSLRALVIVFTLLSFGCSPDERLPSVPAPTITSEPTPKPALELIDLTKVPRLNSKGRFQEGDTVTGESNLVAREIVAAGKDAIPLLISKLEDEPEIDRGVKSFWGSLYVGDMALIILSDLFQDETEMGSTIPGFAWDEFLERGGDRSMTGEEVLRRYIEKYGRRKIKERWKAMWEQKRNAIFWDGKCYCYKVNAAK